MCGVCTVKHYVLCAGKLHYAVLSVRPLFRAQCVSCIFCLFSFNFTIWGGVASWGCADGEKNIKNNNEGKSLPSN